jgi:hypothetical protein
LILDEDVEMIFSAGGEDVICASILSNYRKYLCVIYCRKTDVAWRNHHEYKKKIGSSHEGGE